MFFLLSCSPNIPNKDINFNKDVSFNEFRIMLEEYAKMNQVPNINKRNNLLILI